MKRLTLAVAIASALVTACGAAGTQQSPVDTLAIGSDGFSQDYTFRVPEDARSVSILVTGLDTAHYALSSFRFAGGDDFVRYPDPESIRNQLGRLASEQELMVAPGGLVQESRLGVYTLTLPFAPDQPIRPGLGSIVVMSSSENHQVEVHIVTSSGDAERLAVEVYSVDGAALSSRVIQEVDEIYAQAGIAIQWETYEATRSETISALATFPLGPPSEVARVVARTKRPDPSGLSVFVFPSLPDGVSGLSLSIPAPHDPGSAMTGIVAVPLNSPFETARILAHELGHQLGLRHLETRSTAGVLVLNPITDTYADAYNLMQFGTHLTPGQIEVLRASPYLSASGVDG